MTAARRPGRPKGQPKTGGRRAGTPNRATLALRERIVREADPIAVLCAIAAGERMHGPRGYRPPTIKQRLKAAKALTTKLPGEADVAGLVERIRQALDTNRLRLPEGFRMEALGPYAAFRPLGIRPIRKGQGA
jgi:hypothetical protein